MDTLKAFRESCDISALAFVGLDSSSMRAFAGDLLKNSGRLYYRMDTEGRPRAFFVACPPETGNSMVDVMGAISRGEATIYDVTFPCPPVCP